MGVLKKGASSFKGRQRRLCLCGILLEIAGVRLTTVTDLEYYCWNCSQK